MRIKIVLVMLMIMTLAMFGCSSNETNYVENNPDSTSSRLSTAELAALVQIPVIFGVGDTEYAEAQYKDLDGIGTSSLYWINATDGSAAKIGDIGYRVNGIAYNAVTKKLYGITSNLLPGVSGNYKGTPFFTGSQLIEINIATGAGTIIGEMMSPNSSSVIDENNGFDGNLLGSVGESGIDFFAQSFIANVSTITKFGVRIREMQAEGEVLLAIAADNGSGEPNVSAPLYQGTLKNPSTSSSWFYEEGISVPVTIGQKYWVLIDGYNNAGATGKSVIGISANYTDTGEGMIFSNNGGETGTWYPFPSEPLAIYVEGSNETGHSSFSHPTFNSSGTLFAWNDATNTLCTIDLTNGMANPIGIPIFGVSEYFGLAFDNSNVLYLIDGNNNKGTAIGADVYTLDTSGGLASWVKTITGLPNDMAYNGDFDPITGKYWGLGMPGSVVFDWSVKKEYTQDLLVIDIGNGTLMNTIPTINNLRAITFGYIDPITLVSDKMVSLCNYLKDMLNPPN